MGPNGETQIVRAILAYLAVRPDVLAWRCQSGRVKSRRGGWLQLAPTGTSDIVGVFHGGRFLAIEVKNGRGKQTDEQRRFCEDVMLLDGVYILAGSVEEVKIRLDALRAGLIAEETFAPPPMR